MSVTIRQSFDSGGVSGKVRQAAEKAMLDAGEFLLETANRTVPIEEGTLARSGSVSMQSDKDGIVVRVGYDSPYAVVQHEKQEFRHDDGRRAKWLELTMAEQAAYVGNFLAQALGGALS